MANGDTEVAEGDSLIVKGVPDPERLYDFGLREREEGEIGEALASQDFPLVEVVIPPRSEWAGKTLCDIHLRERYQIQALAIWREGEIVLQDLANLPLRVGDAALMQGPSDKFSSLLRDPNVLILAEETERKQRAVPARGRLWQ
jgi:uncharacterized protein with PhoU and TrkA domain